MADEKTLPIEPEPEKEDRGDFIQDESPLDAPSTPEVAAPSPAAPEPEREPMIPHARFEELNQRLKLEQASRLELEARLSTLTQPPPAPKPPPFDVSSAEKEYLQAVLDGNVDKASALMSTIRRHERQQLEEEITARTQREIAQVTAYTALETVAETAMQQYPFLDPTHASANQAAIAEVVEWRDYYLVAKRLTPAKALKAAVDRIAPTYAKPPVSANAPGEPSARTLTQRQANAKAAAQQPPALAGIGERATRQTPSDIAKMTDTEFAALSAAEKAKLRGDLAA